MILPFLRLGLVVDSKGQTPGETLIRVTDEIRRSKSVALQLRRLDLGVDHREAGRLPSNRASVLLGEEVESTNDGSLDTFLLGHSDLGKNEYDTPLRIKSTYTKDSTRASTSSIADDADVFRREERCIRRSNSERLTLVPELLAECILLAIDHLFDRWFQPVEGFWEVGTRVGKPPVDRVIQEVATFRNTTTSNNLSDVAGEVVVPSLGVKASLRNGGTLWANKLQRSSILVGV